METPRCVPLCLIVSSLDLAGRVGGEYWVPASTVVITGEGELPWIEAGRGRLLGFGNATGDAVE